MARGHRDLLDQLYRLPLDPNLNQLITKRVNQMDFREASQLAEELKRILDRLPTIALNTLG